MEPVLLTILFKPRMTFPDMIHLKIQHNLHIAIMCFLDQLSQFLHCSIVLINGRKIKRRTARIISVHVLDNRIERNGRKSHFLYVIQLFRNTCKVSPLIGVHIINIDFLIILRITVVKSVYHYIVNGIILPVRRTSRFRKKREEKKRYKQDDDEFFQHILSPQDYPYRITLSFRPSCRQTRNKIFL